MASDLILRNARLPSAGPDNPTVDIGVRDGIIVAVEPSLAADGLEHDAGGKLVSPGIVERHFHLDKAMIVDRVPIQPDRMVRDHMKRYAQSGTSSTPAPGARARRTGSAAGLNVLSVASRPR